MFAAILSRNGYAPNEVLVVGDDPESEIAAAKSLGIPTVLYDKNNNFSSAQADYKISNFAELKNLYLNS